MKRSLRTQPIYYVLNTIAALLVLGGLFVTFILTKILVIYAFDNLEDTSTNSLLSYLVYVLLLGLVMVPFKLLINVCFKIIKKSRKFKFSYIENYGKDFPKPKFEDYQLSPKERASYSSKFKQDLPLIPILVTAVFLIVFNVFFVAKANSNLVFFLTPILFIGTMLITQQVNKYYSKQWKQHERVKSYDKALKIYNSIQKEMTELNGEIYFRPIN